MKSSIKKKAIVICLTAASGGITYPVFAQPSGAMTIEEVIVSARRRDENLQNVPVTVNVVSGDLLDDLNILRFEDLEEVVAGLELEDRAVGPLASMRGIRFDARASGNNPSVEFYLNDVLISSNTAMQSMFDVDRIEVLRGPQGTLRGRAAPSGSIIMTSKRPDLERLTGNIDFTATDEGGQNVNAGISIPIVQDVLGLRIAGFSEENRINHVKSFRTGERSEMESQGHRTSLRFQPIEAISVNAYYQKLSTDRWNFAQLETTDVEVPLESGVADSLYIEDSDRLSGQRAPTTNFLDMERTGLEIAWDLGPVKLHYSGALTDTTFSNATVGDTVGFYDERYPAQLQGFINQTVENDIEAVNHELRLGGDINEKMSYVAGVFYSDFSSSNDVVSYSPIFRSSTDPRDFFRLVESPVVSGGQSKEISYFGNLTYRFTPATELSAGLRLIDYESESSTRVLNGATLADERTDETNVIYTASLAHNFTENVMGYVTLGTSWRPGVQQVGNTDSERTLREQRFLSIGPEESESIEFGLKTVSLDNRLRLNGTIFYQRFDGYPDRGAGGAVRYIDTDNEGGQSVETDTFLAPLDVNVYGLELDGSYQITENWNVSGNYSWAQGIQEGEIACNDYNPKDGSPDSFIPTISIDDLRAANDGDDIGRCDISERSYEGPTWSTSLRTEYSRPVFDNLNAYVRLQTKINGAAKGAAQDPNDDVSSYATFNIYFGLRSSESQLGRWEVMAFVKNIGDTQKRLSYGTLPITTSVRTLAGTVHSTSPYRSVTLTEPREVGINVRYEF
jgi:iron complex outermembrane receptor protein